MKNQSLPFCPLQHLQRLNWGSEESLESRDFLKESSLQLHLIPLPLSLLHKTLMHPWGKDTGCSLLIQSSESGFTETTQRTGCVWPRVGDTLPCFRNCEAASDRKQSAMVERSCVPLPAHLRNLLLPEARWKLWGYPCHQKT